MKKIVYVFKIYFQRLLHHIYDRRVSSQNPFKLISQYSTEFSYWYAM